ncbi:hypothetical protein F4781DRAFT_436170 [Annulohypoxylon bovei var. microspora]|nr:hypothetical protein F4781DRAFT_436170 [Annulohypoxylon bovei var. microspora]
MSSIKGTYPSPQSWEAIAHWADGQLKNVPQKEEEEEEKEEKTSSPLSSTSCDDSITLGRPLSNLERGRRTALLCPAWAPYVDKKVKPVPQYVLDTIRMVEFTPINLDSRLLSQRNCSISPESWNNGQFSDATPLLPSTRFQWFPSQPKPRNEHQPPIISDPLIYKHIYTPSPATDIPTNSPRHDKPGHQANTEIEETGKQDLRSPGT